MFSFVYRGFGQNCHSFTLEGHYKKFTQKYWIYWPFGQKLDNVAPL